jgi:hypothetical protein
MFAADVMVSAVNAALAVSEKPLGRVGGRQPSRALVKTRIFLFMLVNPYRAPQNPCLPPYKPEIRRHSGRTCEPHCPLEVA